MGKLSDYAENRILDHILKNTPLARPAHLYLALCKADPGEAATGSSITEPSGGGYARQIADSWEAAAARAASNSTAIAFPAVTGTWGTISHFALCDGLTTGNVWIYGAVNPARIFFNGDNARVAKDDLDVSVDATAGKGMSNYLANSILDHILVNTPLAQPSSLFIILAKSAIADDTTGISVVEPIGSNYARKNHNSWKAASLGISANSGDIIFTAATTGWGTITHTAVADAATNGNIYFYAAASVDKVIGSGDVVKFATNKHIHSLD